MGDLGLETHDLIAALYLFLSLIWITWSDLRSLRIPDRASFPLIAVGLMLAVLPGGVGIVQSLTGAALGYVVFSVLGGWYHRRTGQDGLGLGDAKLLAAAGAWLGWRDLPLLVAIAALSALTFAVLTKKRRLAFGPWLSAAFAILWVRQLAG